PDNPVAGAAIYTARIMQNQVTHKTNKQGREDLFFKGMEDSESEGHFLSVTDPVEHNAAIEALNKGHKPLSGYQLPAARSDKEREIYRKLDEPVGSLDFKETPLQQVLDDLHSTNGINIVNDEPALNEAGIRLDRPVTMRLDGVALKSALTLLLHQAHLTYVVD